MIDDTTAFFYLGITGAVCTFIISMIKICCSSRCDYIQLPFLTIHRNVYLENQENNVNQIIHRNDENV